MHFTSALVLDTWSPSDGAVLEVCGTFGKVGPGWRKGVAKDMGLRIVPVSGSGLSTVLPEPQRYVSFCHELLPDRPKPF